MQRVDIAKHPGNHRVAGLVVRGDELFLFRDDPRLSLRSRDDSVDCFLEFGHANFLLVAASAKNGCLVDQVRQVGAGKARGLLGQDFHRDARLNRLAPHVNV